MHLLFIFIPFYLGGWGDECAYVHLVCTLSPRDLHRLRVVRALAIVSQATRTLLWAHYIPLDEVSNVFRVHTAKKALILLFWQLHLSPELQLLTRIVPCGSQLCAVKYPWSTGKAEVATREGKFAEASDKYYTQQKASFPSLQRALVIVWTAVLIPICDLF